MKRLLPVLCLFVWLVAAQSFAGSATWNLNPANDNWNSAINWTPNTIPDGIDDVATFGLSNQTSVVLNESVTLDQIDFDASASSYNVTCLGAFMSMWGAGMINNSGVAQTFVAQETTSLYGGVAFYNSASAGDSSITYINTGSGVTSHGAIDFFGSSSAGSATFINQGGTLDFEDNSSAGTGTFISHGATDSSFASVITFGDSSTADHGTFICKDRKSVE